VKTAKDQVLLAILLKLSTMNKLRSEYIYRLIGQILSKRSVSAPFDSKYAGKSYLKLMVVIKNNPQIKTIQAFPNKLTNPQIWTDLEVNNYLGKKYILSCQNYRGSYHLMDWKELKDHGSN